nr:MAG TPA: hypothetical protein [Caudoviricetes sp.]
MQNAQSKALNFRHEHTLPLPCLASMLITSATALESLPTP